MKKYIGYDKTATEKNPATEKLVDLCKKRWDAKNLGTLVVREIRGGKPGQMSQKNRHASCFIRAGNFDDAYYGYCESPLRSPQTRAVV